MGSMKRKKKYRQTNNLAAVGQMENAAIPGSHQCELLSGGWDRVQRELGAADERRPV